MKGVYKITCEVNGKVYIDCSFDLEHDLDKAMDMLYSGNHPNKNLQEDMNRYGEAEFRKSIIEEYEGKNTIELYKLKEKNIIKYRPNVYN